jgi:hypothetical protein
LCVERACSRESEGVFLSSPTAPLLKAVHPLIGGQGGRKETISPACLPGKVAPLWLILAVIPVMLFMVDMQVTSQQPCLPRQPGPALKET